MTTLSLWNKVHQGTVEINRTWLGKRGLLQPTFRHRHSRIWKWVHPNFLHSARRGTLHTCVNDARRFKALPLLYCQILVDIAAHAGWITGMDLASQSGLLISSGEDSFVRVWQLSASASGHGRLVSHKCSIPVQDSLLTGVKFLDPKGSAFATSCYDSNKIQVYKYNM